MAIIERRVFYGKVGAAGELVAVQRDFFEALNSAGHSVDYRILTDYQSGRTDRVVYEMELESLGQMETVLGALMQDETLGQALAALESRLNNLVTHAEVEHWQIAE